MVMVTKSKQVFLSGCLMISLLIMGTNTLFAQEEQNIIQAHFESTAPIGMTNFKISNLSESATKKWEEFSEGMHPEGKLVTLYEISSNKTLSPAQKKMMRNKGILQLGTLGNALIQEILYKISAELAPDVYAEVIKIITSSYNMTVLKNIKEELQISANALNPDTGEEYYSLAIWFSAPAPNFSESEIANIISQASNSDSSFAKTKPAPKATTDASTVIGKVDDILKNDTGVAEMEAFFRSLKE